MNGKTVLALLTSAIGIGAIATGISNDTPPPPPGPGPLPQGLPVSFLDVDTLKEERTATLQIDWKSFVRNRAKFRELYRSDRPLPGLIDASHLNPTPGFMTMNLNEMNLGELAMQDAYWYPRTSELMSEILAMDPEKPGTHPIFVMPMTLRERLNTSRYHSKAREIQIDTWESFDYFSDMLFAILLGYGDPKAVRDPRFLNSLKFFLYHEWYLDEKGEVYKTILDQMDSWLCQEDPQAVGDDSRFNGRFFQFRESQYAGREDVYTVNGKFQYPGMLGAPYSCFALYPQENQLAFDEVIRMNGFGMLLEYTAMRYMNLSVGQFFDQSLAKASEAALISAAGQGIALAGVAVAGAVAGASIPVAGWIAAGVGVLLKFIQGIAATAAAIKRNQVIREKAAIRLENILEKWFKRPDIISSFSGYRLDLLLPRNEPFWNDISEYDPLWHHYVRAQAGIENTMPQLPWWYLNTDFDLVIGQAVRLVGGGQIALLRPIQDERCRTIDWKVVYVDPNELVTRTNLNLNYRSKRRCEPVEMEEELSGYTSPGNGANRPMHYTKQRSRSGANTPQGVASSWMHQVKSNWKWNW